MMRHRVSARRAAHADRRGAARPCRPTLADAGTTTPVAITIPSDYTVNGNIYGYVLEADWAELRDPDDQGDHEEDDPDPPVPDLGCEEHGRETNGAPPPSARPPPTRRRRLSR